MSKPLLSTLEAAYAVLRKARKPLHVDDLSGRMLDSGRWDTISEEPWNVVRASLHADIQKKARRSRFRKTAPATFALREPKKPSAQARGRRSSESKPASEGTMTYLEATEQVLRDAEEPLHYADIAERAIDRGLISDGEWAAGNVTSVVGTDIRRREQRGEPQRFVRHERGVIGLAEPLPKGVAQQIEHNNRQIRDQMMTRLRQGSPEGFEELIEELLDVLGFEEVERTPLRGDGGIDVKGTLVVAGTVRIRMAVQAKRWQNNVQANTVREVRGSLGAHEQGLIITTSSFSKGARDEAMRSDASPVALMEGENLIDLLVDHKVGVETESYSLLRLADET